MQKIWKFLCHKTLVFFHGARCPREYFHQITFAYEYERAAKLCTECSLHVGRLTRQFITLWCSTVYEVMYGVCACNGIFPSLLYYCLLYTSESQSGSCTRAIAGAVVGTGLGTAAVYTAVLVATMCFLRRRCVYVVLVFWLCTMFSIFCCHSSTGQQPAR